MKRMILALSAIAIFGCDTDKEDKDKSITILELGGSGFVCQSGQCSCVKDCQPTQTATPIKPPTVIVNPERPQPAYTPTPCPTPTVSPANPNVGINIDVNSTSSSSSTSGSTTQVTQSQNQCQKQFDFNDGGIFTCKYRCPNQPPCLDKGKWTPVQGKPRTASLVYETSDCGSPYSEEIAF